MKINTELLRETAVYIKQYFSDNLSSKFSFHNYEHTANVVRYCDAIGLNMELGKQDLMTLHIAAWFQEAGYCTDPDNHESASIQLAKDFLQPKGIDEEILKLIEECILSTRNPQQPFSLISQVLCDANMYYLADKNYLHNIENLRTEIVNFQKKEFTEIEWLTENLDTLDQHFYYTSYARKLFDKDKEKVKSKLKDQIDILKKIRQESGSVNTIGDDLLSPNDIYETDYKLERGVETLFRITARRHMELASLAHDKANLIISINAIMISVILSVLVVKLDEHSYLTVPTLLFVLTSVATITIAIISTRPRILKNIDKSHQGLAHTDDQNILFFGHFAKLSLDEYEKAMKDTYKNRDQLYESLTKDIYYQGLILVWKYKYITLSYNIFIFGFVTSVLSFIVAFIFHTPIK